ncbi:MAG: hypothetical protein DWP97_01385 [Calditrichaeota bacterium]|nr:MAG: hypothetical protein DWP97_01385 [Calditrichota bacterium]
MEEYKEKFDSENTIVFAINPASVTSHENYCSKKGFSFPILSDSDRTIAAKFKALKENGKSIQRTVYAFDPEGKIIYAEQGMGNYDDILDIIRG